MKVIPHTGSNASLFPASASATRNRPRAESKTLIGQSAPNRSVTTKDRLRSNRSRDCVSITNCNLTAGSYPPSINRNFVDRAGKRSGSNTASGRGCNIFEIVVPALLRLPVAANYFVSAPETSRFPWYICSYDGKNLP